MQHQKGKQKHIEYMNSHEEYYKKREKEYSEKRKELREQNKLDRYITLNLCHSIRNQSVLSLYLLT